MAMNDEQKAVQGIKDPAARKAAYYRLQRQSAEKAADSGDRKAAGAAANIYGKLGNKDKNRYYSAEHYFGKPAADVGRVVDRVGSAAGKALDFAVPEAKAARVGSSIASRLEAPMEEAVNSVRQWLGKARPVAKKLEGGPRKVGGGGEKALTSKQGALKSASAKSRPALPSGKSEPKALMKPKTASYLNGEAMKPSARAASSPTERKNPLAFRHNPQTGKRVGKSPMDIAVRASNRASKNYEKAKAERETAEMNKQAAKQTPRSRGLRKEEKPVKGGYASAKPKSMGEAKGKAKAKIGAK